MTIMKLIMLKLRPAPLAPRRSKNANQSAGRCACSDVESTDFNIYTAKTLKGVAFPELEVEQAILQGWLGGAENGSPADQRTDAITSAVPTLSSPLPPVRERVGNDYLLNIYQVLA